MATILNASTSSGLVQSADTSGDLELQSNGSTKLTVSSTGVSGTLVQGTVNAGGTNPFPSSGGPTVVDFTGIPSWVKRITVSFDGVSTNGTSNYLIQLGDSGGVETTGYLGASNDIAGGYYQNYTNGIGIYSTQSANIWHGSVIISLVNGNSWSAFYVLAHSNNFGMAYGAATKTLSDTLTQVRITTVNGTDTFDAGSINIQYEG